MTSPKPPQAFEVTLNAINNQGEFYLHKTILYAYSANQLRRCGLYKSIVPVPSLNCLESETNDRLTGVQLNGSK